MTNVLPFVRRPKAEPAPTRTTDPGLEKLTKLTQAEADQDFGLYVWMLREFASVLEQTYPREGVDYLRDLLAYEVDSPAPGQVKFELFGWVAPGQPRAEKPSTVSRVFLSITQSKIDEPVEPSHAKYELCLAKLRGFMASWAHHAAGDDPIPQWLATPLFLGYLASTGAFIAHYRVAANYHGKSIVVMQHPKFSTEYRVEVDYSALLEPKQ
jgi:hypothetical protein